MTISRTGPLAHLKVIEFAGIGPGPFAGMLLADMGADVVRIDRAGLAKTFAPDVLARGKRSVALDLKKPGDLQSALDLCGQADVLIEGFRPGVMERLGLGPDVVHGHNPALVYGRMTGWGQTGPLAQAAGHDLNYIAVTGALAAIGEKGQRPVPPLNLVGDFGGGTLYLLMGILAALQERTVSGLGQVIDAAMIDGASSLMASFYGRLAQGRWKLERGSNLVDGGAHFYGTYECADGRYVAIGAIEPQFYAELRRLVGLETDEFDGQNDEATWPRLRGRVAQIFLRKTRQEWCDLMEGTDACFAPVLDMAEAPLHPHNKARATFLQHEGAYQPAPAPRFSRTPGSIQGPAPTIGQHTQEVLAQWLSADSTQIPGHPDPAA